MNYKLPHTIGKISGEKRTRRGRGLGSGIEPTQSGFFLTPRRFHQFIHLVRETRTKASENAGKK